MNLKGLFKTSLLLFIITLFTTVNEVFAQITANVTSGCPPLVVNFTGPNDTWDFGNAPPVVAGPNPSRIYNLPGTYTVSRAGAPGFSITITVFPLPVANFNATTPTSGCATLGNPLNVSFQDLSTPGGSGSIVFWEWDFGNGNTSNLQNPTHSYTTSGVFNVSLRVRTNNGCERTEVRNAFVNTTGGINVTFTPDQSLSCTAPRTVQFTNTTAGIPPGSTISWEFFNFDPVLPQGIGTPVVPSLNTSVANPLITFNNLGDYTVRLSITEPGGCTSRAVKPAMVRLRQYGLNFTQAIQPGPGGSCNPVPVRFTNLFQNVNQAWQTVTWEFINSTNTVIGTIAGPANQGTFVNPLFNFPGPGNYTVRVSAQGTLDSCPIQTNTQSFTIGGIPTASFTVNDSTSCQAPFAVNFNASGSLNAVSYAWDFDDNGVIDDTTVAPSFNYTTPGLYTVRLTVRDSGGCASEVVRNRLIQIVPVQPGFQVLNPNGCNALNGSYTANFQDTTISATTITNWTWQFFDSLGTLLGTVSGSNPNIHQNPSFTFTTDTAINRGRASYNVRLIISTIDGCTDTVFVPRAVLVGNKPVAAYSSTPPFGCINTTVNFTYLGTVPFDTVIWFPLGYGSGNFTTRIPPASPNFNHSYDGDPDTYVAGLIVWNGGCADSTNYSANNFNDPKFTQLLPKSDISFFINNCDIGEVFFVDQSIGSQKWVWEFGDPLNTVLSDSITKYLPGNVPPSVRNPTFLYPVAGNYNVTLTVSHDNIITVRDGLGAVLNNSFFANTGNPFTYFLNTDGDSILSGPVTTSDSLLIIRCEDASTINVNVPTGSDQTVTFTSDYDSTAQNCGPVTVDFTLTTSNVQSVFWNFGNGITSTSLNPRVVLNETGSYTVGITLVTTDGCRFQKSFPDYIKVYGPRVGIEFCESAACIGENIQFVDNSYSLAPITQRTWNMGDGTIFTSDPFLPSSIFRNLDSLRNFNYFYSLPLPGFQTPGMQVLLQVVDARGCIATDSFRIRPTEPIVEFTFNNTAISCDTDSVRIIVGSTEANGFRPFRIRYEIYDTLSPANLLFSSGPGLATFQSFNLSATNDTVPRFYDVRVIVEDFKFYDLGTGCTAERTERLGVFPGKPQALFGFTADTNACPPRSVQFLDSSIAAIRGNDTIPIVSWQWDFGDGTTSTVRNPSKIYTTPNLAGYTITLTVTDATGCSNTITLNNAVIIRGVEGTFTAQEISPTIGPVLSTGSIINFVQGPFNPLPYTVAFNAILSNPADTALVLSYLWDFGDGNLGSGPNVDYTYIIPGVYAPALIIQSIDGCQVSANNVVNVVANGCPPPVILGDTAVCRGSTFQLIGLPPPGGTAPPYTNPTWTVVGPGTVIGNFDTLNATLNSSVTLQYSITDSSGCVGSAFIFIRAIEPPVVDLGNNLLACIGQDVTLGSNITGGSGFFTYSWTSLPAIPGLPATDTIVVTNIQATTQFTLAVLDTISGCSANDNVVVNVNPPPTVNAGPDILLCSGNSAPIPTTVGGGTGNPLNFSSAWTPIFGLSSANIRNPVVSGVNQTLAPIVRTYTVTATDSLGCFGRDTLQVTISPEIVITGFPDRIICLGDNIVLNGNVTGGVAPLNFNWTIVSGTAGSINNPTILNPTVNPTQATQYRLTVTDGNGCTAIRLVTVTINPAIALNAGPDRFVCRGSNIQLNSNASGGTGSFIYQWTSTPTVTFSNPNAPNPQIFNLQDSVRIVIRVTDANSCIRLDTLLINMSRPVAEAGPNRTICSGDSAQFLGSGSGGFGAYTYTWLIPTGLSNPTTQNPRVSRINPTSTPQSVTYFLVVRDSINCPSQPDSVFLIINPQPNSDFSGLDSAYCINAPAVTLAPTSAGGVFSGPGTTAAGIFTPATAGLGLHTIRHVVTSLGCSDTTRKVVRVSPLPNATFSGLPATLCRNAPPVTLLPATPGGLFSGPGVSPSGVFNPISLSVTGNITIKYVVNVAGCPDSTSQIVNVLPTPNPFFTGPDTIVCVNGPVSVMIPIVGGGVFSGQGVVGSTFNPSIAGAGIRFVQYKLTANGCTDSLVKQIVVNGLPNASFSGLDNLNCANQPVRNLIPSIPGGAFTGTGVTLDSLTGIYSFSPPLADTGFHRVNYALTVNGCTDSLARIVRLNRSFALVDTPIRVCEGIPLNLYGRGISTSGSESFKFGWFAVEKPDSLPAGVSGLLGEDVIDSIANPTFLTSNIPGRYTYRLRVRDSTGCVSDNDTFQVVNVIPKPVILPRDSIVFCFEELTRTTITIAPGYSTYYWLQFNDSTPDIEIIRPGFYAYEVSDSTGCRNTDSLYVTEICAPKVFVPNAFTPNGDGLNDSLEVFGKYYKDLEIIIYSRWGEIIYVQRSPDNKPWDGKYRAEEVPSGSYIYELKYTSILDGSVTNLRGNVSVIK